MSYLFLDIETVPVGLPDWQSVKAPANYKDPEKIAEYQRENADAEWRSRSFSPMKGRVLCVGLAVDDGPVEVFADWVGQEDWRVMLEVERWLGHQGRGLLECSPVTWNGVHFDIPFMRKRAAKAEAYKLAKMMKVPKPWDSLDMMARWTEGGRGADQYAKLDDVADFFGVKRDNPISGADVADYWLTGRVAEIEQHVRDDVETLRAVARAMGRAGFWSAR